MLLLQFWLDKVYDSVTACCRRGWELLDEAAQTDGGQGMALVRRGLRSAPVRHVGSSAVSALRLRVERRSPGVDSVRFFFFSSRRRHTRCSRDWSSDVCSSD